MITVLLVWFRRLVAAYEEWALEDAELQARRIQGELLHRRRRYALARPLKVEERELLASHVARGGTLCCASGRDWLKSENIPAPWVKAINGWAYDNLVCEPDPANRARLAAKVRALRLDVLPE